MAEFKEVLKQARRMCNEINRRCGECQLTSCLVDVEEDLEETIMKWAAKHPEPKYPTWIEWWNKNFAGDGRRMLTPCSFVSPSELGCSIGKDGCMIAPCKCWHTRIPAEIAEKLGVEPKERKT
jgi:hypothetical protein